MHIIGPDNALEGKMAQTGKVVAIELHAAVTREAPPRRRGRRQRLLSGLSALAFLTSLALPVTFDIPSTSPGFKTALADGLGNGNGDGQGKGNGNGKGRGDENGGGRKPPKGDDGDDDNDDDDDGFGGGGDDRDDGNNDDRATGSDDDFGNDQPGGDDLGEATDGDLDDAVADLPANAPTGVSTPKLPTIQEVFSLGDESVLNSEQELLAIQNGWNTEN